MPVHFILCQEMIGTFLPNCNENLLPVCRPFVFWRGGGGGGGCILPAGRCIHLQPDGCTPGYTSCPMHCGMDAPHAPVNTGVIQSVLLTTLSILLELKKSMTIEKMTGQWRNYLGNRWKICDIVGPKS